MEPKGSKRNPFRGGVSQFIRCEAPSSLHSGIECRITPSLPQQVSRRLTPFSRAVRAPECSERPVLPRPFGRRQSLCGLANRSLPKRPPNGDETDEAWRRRYRQFTNPLSLLGETFMDGSISANSTPHNQVLGNRLILSNLSVQDFFGHCQCIPVIVRPLLGMERHNVTNLESVCS